MEMFDTVALDGMRLTRDGYLVADARIARTGVQLYLGSEVGRPDLKMVRVLRPEDEVFAADAMASIAGRPVTVGHPQKMVTAETWQQYARGSVGSDVVRDGQFVRVPMIVSDADAVGDVRDGKRELSVGYTCDLDWTAGKTDGGQEYDAVQRNIRANHVAIVARGRAGADCRIGDGTPSQDRKPQMDMTTIVLADGTSVQVADESRKAIETLVKQIRDAAAASDAKDGEIAALRASHASAVQAKDGEIAALKASVPDAAAMDKLIAERSALVDSARRLLGDKFDASGKTASEIRRAAVVAKLGDAAVQGKSDGYVDAAFDTIAALAATEETKDPVRDALRARTPARDEKPAYAEFVDHLTNAWKTPATEKETV